MPAPRRKPKPTIFQRVGRSPWWVRFAMLGVSFGCLVAGTASRMGLTLFTATERDALTRDAPPSSILGWALLALGVLLLVLVFGSLFGSRRVLDPRKRVMRCDACGHRGRPRRISPEFQGNELLTLLAKFIRPISFLHLMLYSKVRVVCDSCGADLGVDRD